MEHPRMKKRRCKYHREYFPMEEMLKTNAGWFKDYDAMAKFGLEKAKKDKVKREKKAHTEKKRKLKDEDRSFQLKKTQQIFNAYIRLRDMADPCISCGRFHSGQYHAGHYRSVGANPELRYLPSNCHKQCSACNNHLSGNISNYRIALIRKIGEASVTSLERNHPPKRYTIDNLKTIQKWFKRKTNRLLKEMDNVEN